MWNLLIPSFCMKTIYLRLNASFITIKFHQICNIVRTLVKNLSILTAFNWRICDWVSFMSPSNSPAQEIQSGSLWAPSNGPSAGYSVLQYFHINYNAIPTYFCLDIYLLSNCYSISYILYLKTLFRRFFPTNQIFGLSNIFSQKKKYHPDDPTTFEARARFGEFRSHNHNFKHI